jgi:hypothetical protein
MENNSKIEKLIKANDNMKNKKSKFIFCVPDSQQPNSSTYEMYFHANVMKKNGYDVYMMSDDD